MKPFVTAFASALALSACAGSIVPRGAGMPTPRAEAQAQIPRAIVGAPSTPMPAMPATVATGTNARAVGLTAGPSVGALPFDDAAARRVFASFIASCPAVSKRSDLSGLTRNEDWVRVCTAARSADVSRARDFFAEQFEAVQVGTGAAFATGYYEPEIAGSRTRSTANNTPIYKKPPELLEIDLGAFNEGLRGRKVSGRMANGTLVPFAERGEIEDGALAGRGLELAYAADPVEFFMLQVQGSGRLKLPDGSIMRLTYAGQNGRTYVSVGAYMRERAMLQSGQYTMQGVMAYMRANPEAGRAIMRQNKSFVFFAELNGEGPLGSLNVVVKRQASVATDPMYVPLGAPVFLSMDRTDATGLWVAQDIGGAIKGANRFDTFWGAGDEAARIAGGMTARGTAFILVPRGTLARLGVASGGPTP
jgi:membrane-bound lytic murein transglycosylase A